VKTVSNATSNAYFREFYSMVTDVGINYQTAAGRTPLMVATARGSLRVMELLLNHNARLDIRDAFGQTAESFSIIFNQKQSRRTIIQFNWKKRNEKSMVRERETKSALSRQGSAVDQVMTKMNRDKEERLARLAEQRKQRQEQIAAQQSRLPKKKSKIRFFLNAKSRFSPRSTRTNS
jgi:ankyrin repeat protein